MTACVGVVVVANIVFLGLEVDLRDAEAPELDRAGAAGSSRASHATSACERGAACCERSFARVCGAVLKVDLRDEESTGITIWDVQAATRQRLRKPRTKNE